MCVGVSWQLMFPYTGASAKAKGISFVLKWFILAKCFIYLNMMDIFVYQIIQIFICPFIHVKYRNIIVQLLL